MLQFQAVASHVDWEGRIYLIPLTDFENLRIIKKVLDSKYKDSSQGPEDKNWASGESVIVRWDEDGHWYRGVVMEVNCEEFIVQYVDYGTVEVCRVENMRKEVFMVTTPIQCISIELEDVQPNRENSKINNIICGVANFFFQGCTLFR